MARSKFRKNCLVPLTGKIKKYRFVGFDVETVGDKFYSGGLWWVDEYGVEQWFYTTNKRTLINKVLSREFCNVKNKNSGVRIIATNLSYDFNSLFFDEPEWNEFNAIIMRSSRIMFADWRPPSVRTVQKGKRDASHGRVCFYDTLNYALMSVEKLGELLGIPKMEAPSFLGERAPISYAEGSYSYKQEYIVGGINYYTEAKYLEEYNKRDCMISAKFAEFFQHGINELGGKMQMTSASTSLDLYRRQYMDEEIIKESFITKDDSITDFIFDGYYGGRTEAFSRGKIEGANYYDVNSLYPHVMRNSMPLPQSVKIVNQTDVSLISRYMGVSNVTVYVPKMKYPPLPLKREKLLFPVGTFTGTWNNNELTYAMSLGVKILKVHRQIIYQEAHTPFKRFVEDLYKKRLEYKAVNSSFEVVVKLMMNSLYGKFAQKELSEYRVFSSDDIPEEFVKEMIIRKSTYDINEIDGKMIFRRDKRCSSVFVFPIYSSYITSYARIHIHKLMVELKALYTDTDSIITFEKTASSKELGALKEEHSNEDGIIIKPKFYLFGDQIKIKGLSKSIGINGKTIKTGRNEFNTIMRGGTVTKMRFSSLKESVRRGIAPNTKILVPKQMGVEDDKRVWPALFDENSLQESEAIML